MSRALCMRLLVIVSAALLAASCTAPTLTPTPVPSRTVTPSLPTPTPREPHVTYAPTQADPTPRPTNTPTPCGTCEALHPALYGSVIVQSWEDTNDDGAWQMYADEGLPEWGVASTVALWYASDLPLDIWPVTGVQIPITWRGIGVYTTLLPGLYNVMLYSYEDTCLVPYYDNDLWATVNAAGQAVVHMRFWRKPGCDAYATPGPTPTPSVTPTPITVPCPDYYNQCQPACSGNTQADPYKSCGPGLVCCMPMPTRTAIP